MAQQVDADDVVGAGDHARHQRADLHTRGRAHLGVYLNMLGDKLLVRPARPTPLPAPARRATRDSGHRDVTRTTPEGSTPTLGRYSRSHAEVTLGVESPISS
jgi:hypothetical protein